MKKGRVEQTILATEGVEGDGGKGGELGKENEHKHMVRETELHK